MPICSGVFGGAVDDGMADGLDQFSVAKSPAHGSRPRIEVRRVVETTRVAWQSGTTS